MCPVWLRSIPVEWTSRSILAAEEQTVLDNRCYVTGIEFADNGSMAVGEEHRGASGPVHRLNAAYSADPFRFIALCSLGFLAIVTTGLLFLHSPFPLSKQPFPMPTST